MLSAAGEGVGACKVLTPDLDAVIQITVVVADSVEVADTLRARASAGTARGDTVPTSSVWTSFDTTILAVADSSAGLFIGRRVGTASIQALARIQASTDSLRSNPIPVRVTPATP
jgi:hypothetical protein